MTEQEQREKAMIEKVLSDEQSKIANTVDEFAKLQKEGISKCYADALYDACYRKEDEVRKETIKEFIDFIESVIYNYEPTVTETDSGIRTYQYLSGDELFDIIIEKYEMEIKNDLLRASY